MIGVIVAVYSVYPEKLFSSILTARRDVNFYLFFHGNDPTLKSALSEFASTQPNVTLLLYGLNRGLARSWNDGLRLSSQAGDKWTLIANDDLYFRQDGFDEFFDFVEAQPPDFGLATMMGWELEGSPNSGETLKQELACCVIGQRAIESVGYFDQRFTPAYFEDVDYIRRLGLANLTVVVDARVLVEHERSKTSRTDDQIKNSLPTTFALNQQRFQQKWGGVFGGEHFVTPFNDPRLSLYIGYDEQPHNSPSKPERTRAMVADNVSLDVIGLRTGTDKSSQHHDFLNFYERFLAERRLDITTILEIGVSAGGSVRMWEEYLPNAKIVALDINPEAVRHASASVTIEIVDQSDPKQLIDVAVKHGPFDMILDDGSHFWNHQILTFQCLFPFVKRSGIYILEDIDTSYGSYVQSYNNNSSVPATDYLKKIVDRIVGDKALDGVPEPDMFVASYAKLIESISFYRRTSVLQLK